MTGEFPEDWFRPASDGSGTDDDATRVRTASQERYTDQFKPTWTTRGDAAASTPPSRPAPTPAPPQHRHDLPLSDRSSHSVGVARFTPSSTSREEVIDPGARSSGWRRTIGLVLGAAALAGAGWATWQVLHHDDPATVPTNTSAVTTPSSGTGAASQAPQVAWTGPVKVVRPTAVAASCTAPDQKGYNGETISSAPTRIADADATTGWRCDGASTGQSLTFQFAPGTRIVGVRVVNGYTKITNGVDLYPQYRRATSLEWSFPQQQAAYFVQGLRDATASYQETRIPEISTDGGVRMTVKVTTAPGSREPSRDALVLTEVVFLAKA